MVERGFDVHQLDNMKIDGEMFEYIESFFRPNDEKGWNALDNHHVFRIIDENGKWFTGGSYHKRVLFSNEYGTKDELLKKGYVENETMFYYPSNGEKIGELVSGVGMIGVEIGILIVQQNVILKEWKK